MVIFSFLIALIYWILVIQNMHFKTPLLHGENYDLNFLLSKKFIFCLSALRLENWSRFPLHSPRWELEYGSLSEVKVHLIPAQYVPVPLLPSIHPGGSWSMAPCPR